MKSKWLKQISTALVLLTLGGLNINSQTVLTTDNFDVGIGNWNIGGIDAFLLNPTSINGTQGVNLQDNSGVSSSIFTNDVDITPYGSVTIEFEYRSSGLSWGMDFFVEYSDDGGVSWNTIANYRRGPDFNNNTNYTFSGSIDTNGYLFSINSRFRIRADFSSDSNDIYIDNAVITGFPPAPEIDISSNQIEIADGDNTPYVIDNTDFGSADLGTTISRRFKISNNGTADLNISSISLSNTTDFSIVGTPFSGTVPILGSTTFKIRFNSLSVGTAVTTVTISNDDSNENPYTFDIKANAILSFFDSDGDGVFDNVDIDDDNDGITDSDEELACKNSSISVKTNYKFLNETFGEGNRTTINTTYDAVTTYCFEDGTASCPTLGGIDLNDGEYTVYYRAADGDGINDTPIEELGSWADDYWYTGEDHTPSDTNGRMAMFNAAIDPGIFYTASITGALPNVPVTYSFWVLNLDTVDAPSIGTRLRPDILVEFRDVNDNILASITTGDIPPSVNGDPASSWHNFSADLTFGVSEFNVYFYNNQLGGLGNDLAIDDIEITQTLCDTDNDGVADVFDLDSDNDGIPDVVESGFVPVSNGTAKIDTWIDTNGNGMHDAFEGLTVLDSDGDGTPNYIDLDSDNDSIFDVDESGAGNTGDPNFQNGDGDIDGDGVGDGSDTDAVREKDFNSDGTSEYFTDGILDIYDFFNGVTLSTAYGNQNQGIGHINFVADTDSDGLPDYIDTYNNLDGTYDISHTLYSGLDANNDGVIDDTADSEGDGILDLFDTNDSEFGSPRDLNIKLQLYFDGRNDFVQDSSITSSWDEITLMGWIKIEAGSTGTTRMLFGQDNFNLILRTDNRVQLQASGSSLTSDNSLPESQWIHLTGTYSNSLGEMKLYINGLEDKSTSKSGALNSDTSLFTIARNPSVASQYFKGFVDEVRLFDKSLSTDEIQKIVYQEIENNGYVRGTEIPRDVESLSWSNLIRYYRLDIFKGDITDDLSTPAIDIGTGAKLYNLKEITYQSAPMPFVSQQGGVMLNQALDIPSDGVIGQDAIDYDWSIVRIEHNDITYDNMQQHLGLFINELDGASNAIEYHVTDDSELNVSWYLKLDGFIDLEGESQLIQGEDSVLDVTSKGKIERDQQGTADTFTYNYWSSPVGSINNTSNNNDYQLINVLKDGTDPDNPVNINWITTGYDGANTSPIGLADYWIWKFDNHLADDYSSWQHVRSTGTLSIGEGYTMKGPGTGPIAAEQNYVFVGKPNNGDITLSLNAGNNYLLGNPYPSAIDSHEFIRDNGVVLGYEGSPDVTPTISGSLYYWEHWGGGSHILAEYQGGYAIYNFSGAVAAPSYGTNDPDVATGGTPTKLPGRYIPVGQGFFVVGDNDGVVEFNNSQRIFAKEDNSNSTFMRSSVAQSYSQNDASTLDDTRLKLRIGFNSIGTIHRQLLLTIDSLATADVDRGFDAVLYDALNDDMYWIIDGGKYTIQGHNLLKKESVFPLGIHTSANGSNEIIIDALENVPETLDIYLHDKFTDVYHNLRQSSYEFNADAGEYLNRFEITFEIPSPETLTIDDLLANGFNIYYSFKRNKIMILNPDDIPLKRLNVFDINGKEVFSKTPLPGAYNEYAVEGLSTGIYVIQLKSENGLLTKKIIVK